MGPGRLGDRSQQNWNDARPSNPDTQMNASLSRPSNAPKPPVVCWVQDPPWLGATKEINVISVIVGLFPGDPASKLVSVDLIVTIPSLAIGTMLTPAVPDGTIIGFPLMQNGIEKVITFGIPLASNWAELDILHGADRVAADTLRCVLK